MQTSLAPSTDKIREEFIELVGRIVQADGMPRNAGRIMGLLIFDGTQTSFGDLAESLQISRGSVSSSSRLLEEFGLIRRVSKPGERQDYFQLEEAPYLNLLDRAGVRQRKAREAIEKLASHLDEGSEVTDRVVEFAEFHASLEHCIGRARLEIKQK